VTHSSAVQEQDILQRLRDVMGAVFGVPAAHIPTDASSSTMAEWDSVRHLQLMLALEDEFGIRLETDELATLRSVPQLVQRLRGSARG
jgi:acyl carrier protein